MPRVPLWVWRIFDYARLPYFYLRNTWDGWRKRNEYPYNVKVGDVVCDCRHRHLRVVGIEKYLNDPHDFVFEDGSHADARACCSPVPHEGYEHEIEATS